MMQLGQILPHISPTRQDPRPVALMTCGLPSSGKSTLANELLLLQLPCQDNHVRSFTRLSIDAHIYDMHGLYRIDYPPERYPAYQAEAAEHVKAELARLLQSGCNVVLDLSFWSREYRDEYRGIIERAGGRAVLVYLQADDKAALWERVQRRRRDRDALPVGDEGRNGDSAVDLSEEVFGQYWDGFEAPIGEGEIVLPVVP